MQPFIVASFTTPTWGSTIANAFLIVQVLCNKLFQQSQYTSMGMSCSLVHHCIACAWHAHDIKTIFDGGPLISRCCLRAQVVGCYQIYCRPTYE